MKLVLSLFSFFVVTCSITFGQNQAAIEAHLFLTDGVQTHTVFFGIDPLATDSLDFELFGEVNLPPIPPAGAMDFRFYLPFGDFSGVISSVRDYRNGTTPFTGQVEHRIRFQRGAYDSLTLLFSFPQEITCNLVDLFGGVVVNTQLVGSGSYTIPNPDALQQLNLLVNYNNATDVRVEKSLSDIFNLSQNFPNPFNPLTVISYTLTVASTVTLKVYDLLGSEVVCLVNEEQASGSYEFNFDGKGLTSGVYFYSLKAGDYTDTKSMILMK